MYSKISFNADAAKAMGKEKFIKTFKAIYKLSEADLAARYDRIAPPQKKSSEPTTKTD